MPEERYDRTIMFNGNSYRNILSYLNGLSGVRPKVVDGEIIYFFERGNIRVTNSEGEPRGTIVLENIGSEILGDLEKLTGARV